MRLLSPLPRLVPLLVFIALPFVTFAQPASAQDPTPLGGEFQINTYTTSYQVSVDVAMDDAGQFVVVWKSTGSPGDDNTGDSIQGQRFDSGAAALGGQFQINVETLTTVSYPAVSAAPNGDFVVVWKSTVTGFPPNFSLEGRRYSSDGMALGGEFTVLGVAGDPRFPDIDVAADGAFVVVWRDVVATGTDVGSTSIQARRFGSDGMAQGSQFQVNTYTTGDQRRGSVAVEPDGDFVIVWQSAGADGNSDQYSVQGQRFASDGMENGTQFQLNAYTTGNQKFPSVGVEPDGDFIVAWESDGSAGDDTSNTSIQVRRFGSDGSALAGDLQVNSHTPSYQTSPQVQVDADGDFVVAWDSDGSAGSDGSSYSVQSQLYTSDGMAVGGQFQVNTLTGGYQYAPGVGMSAGGRFVVAWTSDGSSGTDIDLNSIQGQRYEALGVIFSDGFESGTTMNWS